MQLRHSRFSRPLQLLDSFAQLTCSSRPVCSVHRGLLVRLESRRMTRGNVKDCPSHHQAYQDDERRILPLQGSVQSGTPDLRN